MIRLFVLAPILLVVACGSNEDKGPNKRSDTGDEHGSVAGSTPTGSGGAAAGVPAPRPSSKRADGAFRPLGDGAEVVQWSTDTFMLGPGQERYLCFAKSVEEDLVINGYSNQGKPFLHHIIFSRANQPEPEGFAECNVAFRSGWEQLYITGAGNSVLEFPEDAGHSLPKGTQLIVQMHLLNVAETSVEGSLTIDMRRSVAAAPMPVSSYIFGTAAVNLPARSTGTVVGNCAVRQPVELIAGFPHMHLLGSSLRFEAGKSADALQEVFKRDPFDFDNQRIDKLEHTIMPGDLTRVTCTYNNTLDETVGYGESTHEEMCFFVGFAVDQPRQAACLEVIPPNAFRR